MPPYWGKQNNLQRNLQNHPWALCQIWNFFHPQQVRSKWWKVHGDLTTGRVGEIFGLSMLGDSDLHRMIGGAFEKHLPLPTRDGALEDSEGEGADGSDKVILPRAADQVTPMWPTLSLIKHEVCYLSHRQIVAISCRAEHQKVELGQWSNGTKSCSLDSKSSFRTTGIHRSWKVCRCLPMAAMPQWTCTQTSSSST